MWKSSPASTCRCCAHSLRTGTAVTPLRRAPGKSRPGHPRPARDPGKETTLRQPCERRQNSGSKDSRRRPLGQSAAYHGASLFPVPVTHVLPVQGRKCGASLPWCDLTAGRPPGWTPEKDGVIVHDMDDDVIRGATVAHGGKVTFPPPPPRCPRPTPRRASGAPSTSPWPVPPWRSP